MVAQRFRERSESLGKRWADVIANARARWKDSSEQRRVRRQRERSGGERTFENRAAGSEVIERRRVNAAEPVDGQPIGSHRVEGDDDEIPRAPTMTGGAGHRRGQ